jgi:hypothetical protein
MNGRTFSSQGFTFYQQVAANGQGLLLCWYSLLVQPNLQPNKFIKVQITNKSSKEIGLPKPVLIVNKKMKIYSSASIAANTMLAVVVFFRST